MNDPQVFGSPGVSADKFVELVSRSHRIAVKVDVLYRGETVAEDLPVVAGSVTSDAAQSVRGSVSLQIADPLRVPSAPGDVLSAYGYELAVWRGIDLGAGQIMCPLGVFGIQTSEADGANLLTTVAGQDRAKSVSDVKFEDSVPVASGEVCSDVIESLLREALPDVPIEFDVTPFTTPTLTFGPGDDRWAAIQQIAGSCGNQIYFDGRGVCVMRSEPTFEQTPDHVLSEDTNILGAVSGMDRSTAYNKVTARSSNASLDTQYSGYAVDNDPASPTYYYGGFGRKTRDYASPFLASNAQCQAAARKILLSNLGVARSASVTAIIDPRIAASDVVSVTRTPLGWDGSLHIVDAVTIGLTAKDSMPLRLRSQQEETTE